MFALDRNEHNSFWWEEGKENELKRRLKIRYIADKGANIRHEKIRRWKKRPEERERGRKVGKKKRKDQGATRRE
jgi:hypothetical protein